MSNTTQALGANHGKIRPATSGDIVYRAYGRKYDSGPGQVLSLFASCSYPTGQWKIFFVRDDSGNYKLMEQAPGIFTNLVTYYVADFTTGLGLADPVSSVTIVDGHGKHTVKVELLD